jgi:energy-coupling factor transporter ATP-binding protein EcfA2
MDEPTMRLSPLYVDRMLELIQTIYRQGVTIFMVEQNANLALQIADYGYVLQSGRIALSGRARDLLHKPESGYSLFPVWSAMRQTCETTVCGLAGLLHPHWLKTLCYAEWRASSRYRCPRCVAVKHPVSALQRT